jgi:hypothetical protein
MSLGSTRATVSASTHSDRSSSVRASLNQNLPGESYATQRDLTWVVRGARCLLIVGLSLFVTGVVKAQTPDPSPVDAPQRGIRPALGPFPRFEDWSFLRDPSQRIDPYDRLKSIPLNDSGTNYLTLGVENRTEFQYLKNNAWGTGPQDLTGYVLERLMPSADLRLRDHARIFVTCSIRADRIADRKEMHHVTSHSAVHSLCRDYRRG